MESKILKLCEKYNVEIELKYKKDTIIAIIDNGDEMKVLKNGWIKNLIEEVEEECKCMSIKQNDAQKQLKKDLEILAKNKECLPKSLF